MNETTKTYCRTCGHIHGDPDFCNALIDIDDRTICACDAEAPAPAVPPVRETPEYGLTDEVVLSAYEAAYESEQLEDVPDLMRFVLVPAIAEALKGKDHDQ